MSGKGGWRGRYDGILVPHRETDAASGGTKDASSSRRSAEGSEDGGGTEGGGDIKISLPSRGLSAVGQAPLQGLKVRM